MTQPEAKPQVAVVTGAARGLGRTIAQSLLEAGYVVVAVDVDPAVHASAAALGPDVSSFDVDITDEGDVAAAFAQIRNEHGGIDLLVNNAAITAAQTSAALGGSLPELSVGQWRRVIDVNLTGTFICAREAALRMRSQSHGHIVNIASIQGLVPTRGFADYCTSKAGVIMLTRCLAGELATWRIRVNAIAPGPIRLPDSDPGAAADTLSGDWGTPEDVAAAVMFLASPAGRFVNGQVLSVDDGAALRFREPPAPGPSAGGRR